MLVYFRKPASSSIWESWWSLFCISVLHVICAVLVHWNYACFLSSCMHPRLLCQFFYIKLFDCPTKSLAVALQLYIFNKEVWLYVKKTLAQSSLFIVERMRLFFILLLQTYICVFVGKCLHPPIYKQDAQTKYFIVNPSYPFVFCFEKWVLLVSMAIIKLKEESALQKKKVIYFLVLSHMKRALNSCHGDESLPEVRQNHFLFCITHSLELIKSAENSHILSHNILRIYGDTWATCKNLTAQNKPLKIWLWSYKCTKQFHVSYYKFLYFHNSSLSTVLKNTINESISVQRNSALKMVEMTTLYLKMDFFIYFLKICMFFEGIY